MAHPALRRRLALGAVGVVLLGGLAGWRIADNRSTDYRTEDLTVSSTTPKGAVSLDARLYLPDAVDADHPAPAVILAHGFGGTKESVTDDAADLANRGYVVLAYSARGFGRSTGTIGLDAADGEAADARNLITTLSKRPEVQQDGPDDPRVGIAGESYGGALALMTAGTDERVDAIVPQITWNRLSRVFFPNGAGPPQSAGPAAPADADTVPGAFKREWAGIFFSSGKGLDLGSLTGLGGLLGGAGSGATGSGSTGTGSTGTGSTSGADQALVCGRFDAAVCAVYTSAAASGTLDAAGRDLLDQSSPWSVAAKIKAPTLLVQGEADTLFPLSEADVTASQIRSAGTPVAVRWTAGGHDAGGVADGDDELDSLRQATAAWFDHYLKKDGPTPAADFAYDQQTGLSTAGSQATTRTLTAPRYPTRAAAGSVSLSLSGPAQPVLRPAGGAPASLTGLPGVSAVLGALAFDPPGQAALFSSAPLQRPVDLVGSPTVRIVVTGARVGTTLFAKIYDAPDGGRPQLPQAQVVPVVVPPTTDPSQPQSIEVTLPALAHRFEAGHRVVVAIASTDRAYAGDTSQQVVQVALAQPTMSVPTVRAVAAGEDTSAWVWLAGVIAALALAAALVGAVVRRVARRRALREIDESLLGTPLVVSGLAKSYADGFTAVRQVDLRVEPNQVVGLLGPNGAGKTTSLRMLMGLIRPSAGSIRVFGHEVHPGAPALSRLGCFVEGTGFLPHLSGRANLTLYWASTGRPEADARFTEVLEIAGLGAAIDRRVKTYSQGMRQRLAIAQAMLGLPDLLVLDEPTNGLDPPQMAEMRGVLRGYAVDGRAVLVSSHQLSEVEQTCTHVVVMNLGRVLSAGTVAEVSAAVPADSRHRLEEAFLAMVGDGPKEGT